MLAKLTSKNQITLPKAAVSSVDETDYFDVTVENGRIVLTPVRSIRLRPSVTNWSSWVSPSRMWKRPLRGHGDDASRRARHQHRAVGADVYLGPVGLDTPGLAGWQACAFSLPGYRQ